MRSRVTYLVATLGLLVAACGGREDAATTEPTAATPEIAVSTVAPIPTSTTVPAPPTTASDMPFGCGALHQPGEHEGMGMFEGHEQPYWMVVPDSYADVAPAPLYLHLAAGDGDHDGFLDGWRPYLEDLDGLMVMVNTALAARGEPDALDSLIDEISMEYCVDPLRIHVIGTSHSFGMSEQFACEHSDRVASFVTALGYFSSDCTPDRPVPLLTFSGDTDRAGVQLLVDKWVSINSCDPEPTAEDLGSGVQRKTYENCEADILFYDIEGLGHAWPLHESKGPGAALVAEYEEVDYLEEALAFFGEHPLP